MEHKLLEKVLKIFLLLSTYVIVLYAGTQELHKPTSKTYDFTYNSLNKKSESYKTPKIVPKIPYSVDSELSLIPRHFKVESCPSDKFGNIFCPEALSKAGDTWSYNDGMLYERKESVIDYELGRYQEHKDIVRDFMDGTATTHTNEVTDSLTGTSEVNVGTVTDYQSNSTSVAHASTVMDFADKVGTSTSVEPITELEDSGWKYDMRRAGMISTTKRYGYFISGYTLRSVEVFWNGNMIHSFFISGILRNGYTFTKNGYTYTLGNIRDSWSVGEGEVTVRSYGEIKRTKQTISCPDGYLMNSDKTRCIKLEETVKDVYDSGWIRGDNPWNSWSQDCRDSCSPQRVEGMTVAGNPFSANGYTYTRGSVIFRGSKWTDGFHTLWAYKKTKTTEKCKQYGVMVSVGGKNYCTYEYSYEEPLLKNTYQLQEKKNGDGASLFNRYYDWTNVASIQYRTVTHQATGEGDDSHDYYHLRISNGKLQGKKDGTSENMFNRYYDWRDEAEVFFKKVTHVSYGEGDDSHDYHYLRFYKGGMQERRDAAYSPNSYGWQNRGDILYKKVTHYATGEGDDTHDYYYFRVINNPIKYCKQDGELVTIDGKQMCRYAGESAKCPDFYTDNGTTCQKEITYNFYEYKCPTNYTPVNSGFATFVKNDPDPKAVNENTLDDDVNSATAPAENCKRVIPYNYYNYNCPVGYTVNSGGMGSCDKTDPDRTSDNSSLLSQACNDSTPPEGNCTKQIAYNYYEYGCATGYTAIDKGLTACDKTDSDNTSDSSSNLDDDCNNPTPPPENCYKDIEYKYYSYGCSEGYKTDNYGLNECKKVDPDKSTNNSETLDDNCNSKTPPEGNCRKSIEYSFYEYQCENKNSFDEPYEVQNEGLKTCVKTDTDKNAVNQDTLDDNCNEPTLPTNNCKSKIYTCNSNKVVPAFVDGEWQCSALPCNVNNQCGTARCIEHEPSTQYFMPTGMKPVIPKYSGSCTSTVCDAVSNSTISYCESEGCPDEVGIYEKNGGCYYDDCPLGSKLNNNGECEVVE